MGRVPEKPPSARSNPSITAKRDLAMAEGGISCERGKRFGILSVEEEDQKEET